MDRGLDFLKSQVSNAAMQHGTLLKNLEDTGTTRNWGTLNKIHALLVEKDRGAAAVLRDNAAALYGLAGSG